jgi:hypothetical protein
MSRKTPDRQRPAGRRAPEAPSQAAPPVGAEHEGELSAASPRGTDEPGDQIAEPPREPPPDDPLAPTPEGTGTRTLDDAARVAGGRWAEAEPSETPPAATDAEDSEHAE